MTEKTILFEQAGRVATITLNRPMSMNAINLEMMKELGDCFEELHHQHEIQVVILKGQGKAFSSGGDIKGMIQGDLDLEEAMTLVARYMRLLYTLPKIVIAQVHGAAAGLGLSTALAADYVIAEETAKIAMNFIGIGLIPDGGGHFFMQERLGNVKAKQAIWVGEVMSGTKAQKIGLVDEIVAEGAVDEFVQSMVQRFSHAPLKAMIETKKVLNERRLPELESILLKETEGQKKMRDTKDHMEGIRAFVEKRKPNFKGE